MVETDQFKILYQILRRFQEAGVLQEIFLIGSLGWAGKVVCRRTFASFAVRMQLCTCTWCLWHQTVGALVNFVPRLQLFAGVALKTNLT